MNSQFLIFKSHFIFQVRILKRYFTILMAFKKDFLTFEIINQKSIDA